MVAKRGQWGVPLSNYYKSVLRSRNKEGTRLKVTITTALQHNVAAAARVWHHTEGKIYFHLPGNEATTG